MITVLMQIKREMELQLQLGVSLPKAELYLISKLPNTNVNSNSHRPDIHISIHWGQTANIMSFDEAGNIQAVDPARRMQWMAASWKLFKVTDENKTATGSNKQIF